MEFRRGLFRAVPDRAGHEGTRGGGDAEPGAVGAAVPVSRGAEDGFAVDGVGGAREAATADSGGAFARGGDAAAGGNGGAGVVGGGAAVRDWHAVVGVQIGRASGRDRGWEDG